jgi:hypothetical protein
MREARLTDPDGNVVRIGSPVGTRETQANPEQLGAGYTRDDLAWRAIPEY